MGEDSNESLYAKRGILINKEVHSVDGLFPGSSVLKNLGSSVLKNLPANAGDTGDTSLIPGSRGSTGEGMAAHSSILAWRIPRTGEDSRL